MYLKLSYGAKLMSRFKDTAVQYYKTWETYAIASDRLVLSFGSSASGLIYNLYADKLLGLNLVDTSVSLLTFYLLKVISIILN